MPAAPEMVAPSVAEALLRVGSMFGSVWKDGLQRTDIVEVTATLERGRIDVPIVGRDSMGRKPGRSTRDATLRLQKIDTEWEMMVYEQLAPSLTERRRRRDAGERQIQMFSIMLEWDDPDALGIEKWQLDGCQVWQMQLGGSFTEDSIVEREYPLSWEAERPIYAYRRGTGPGGVAIPIWYPGYGPPSSAS